MPQAPNLPSWSSSHTSRNRPPPPPSSASSPRISKRPPRVPHTPVISDMSRDLALAKAASSGGKKRQREETADARHARRTRSVGGEARELEDSKEASSRERDVLLQRQLIGIFVPRALKESVAGNTVNYSDLLSRFLPTPGQPVPILGPLLPLLRAITAHVSILDPKIHGALVTAIIGLPWASGDDRFVKAYIGWAGVLVSAHPGWAKEIVAMGVKGLTWQNPSPIQTRVTRRVFHARHHLLLQHLLSLVPTLPNVLQPCLNRNAPHKRESEVAQTTWVRNCCELIDYCPELGARVWSSLVDRMLRIDLEITNRAEDDDDDEADDEDGDEPNGQQNVDPFDLTISQDVARTEVDSDDEDDSDDDEDGDPDLDELSSADERDSEDEDDAKAAEERQKKKRDALRTMRAKLDGMLVHFYRHLDESMGGHQRQASATEIACQALSAVSSGASTLTNTPRPGTPTTPTATPASSSMIPPPRPTTPAQSLAHFQTLLNLFSRQILPTTSTHHIPFLLFRTASYSPAHTDLFLHRLVSLALYASDTPTPTTAQLAPLAHRTAATVYIGSLVTRARFVTDDQARTVLAYLLAYVDGKLAQAQSRRLSSDELPLFYAVCQASMLIFCFRWRAFTTDEPVTGEMEMDMDSEAGSAANEAGGWIPDLDVLQRAITSDLNPLLGCNPTIVGMFAKVAHSTGFAYCFSIIEANAHITRSSATSTPKRPASRASSSLTLPHAPRAARQANIDAGLDDYFPFDPYDLPRSGEFVEALYRTWDEVAVDQDGSDSESESGDESMEEEEEEELAQGRISLGSSAKRSLPIDRGSHPHRRHILDPGLGTSLEHMNISPAVV